MEHVGVWVEWGRGAAERGSITGADLTLGQGQGGSQRGEADATAPEDNPIWGKTRGKMFSCSSPAAQPQTGFPLEPECSL